MLLCTMKNTLKFRFALFVIIAALGIGFSQDPYSKLTTDLQIKLDSIVKKKKLPGTTFSLLLDKQHQVNLASGYSDVEKKVALDTYSKMMSGSVGKIFFSTLALKLIQDNKLQLSDKINRYLGSEEWYQTFPNHSEIQIENLLNHTSGLPRHLFQPEFLDEFIKYPLVAREPVECIQSVSNKPAVHAVGQGWSYSDTNYILLGLIIEKVTGKKVYDLVEAEFIIPLGLKNTLPSITNKIAGLSQGYIGPQNPFQLPRKVLGDDGKLVLNPAFEWTGGGFATNPSDLTKMVRFIHESSYLSAFIKAKLVSAASMSTGQPFDSGYGLGSFVWSKMEDKRYGHSGFFPGYVSHVEYSKNRQYAIAVQINDDGAYSLLQQIIYEMEQTIEKYLDAVDEYKIRQYFSKQEKCWNTADIACFTNAFTVSEALQNGSKAATTFGYEEVIREFKKLSTKEGMGNLHIDNIKTRRLGDNLYMATGKINLKFPEQEDISQSRFVVLLKKINGDWKIITEHSS